MFFFFICCRERRREQVKATRPAVFGRIASWMADASPTSPRSSIAWSPRRRRLTTVQDGLLQRAWIRYINGAHVNLWRLVRHIALPPGT